MKLLMLALLTQLTIQGARPGMSYAEVLGVWGVPQEIRWERGFPYLRWADRREAWFREGRAVFVWGKDLDGLFQGGKRGAELIRALGTQPRVLNVFSCWWPESGVCVWAWRALRPDDPVEAVGLRAPALPITLMKGTQWSDNEPWLDDYHESWLMDGVALSCRREEVRKVAGEPMSTTADSDTFAGGMVCRYSRSGWVMSMTGGRVLERKANLGHHNLGTGPLQLGAAPPSWDLSDSKVRILIEKGKCARFELEAGEPELFQALDGTQGGQTLLLDELCGAKYRRSPCASSSSCPP